MNILKLFNISIKIIGFCQETKEMSISLKHWNSELENLIICLKKETF